MTRIMRGVRWSQDPRTKTVGTNRQAFYLPVFHQLGDTYQHERNAP